MATIPPPDVSRGDPVTAELFNKVKQAAFGAVTGRNVFSTVDGVVIRDRPPGAGGEAGAIFKVVREKDDYLVCTMPFSADTTAEVFVAKPYDFQRTPHDGPDNARFGIEYTYTPTKPHPFDPDVTIDTPGTRTATSPSQPNDIIEEQFISPKYRRHEQINATKPKGGTGVIAVIQVDDPDDDDPEVTIDKEVPVLWQQVGTGGKQWRVKLEDDQ